MNSGNRYCSRGASSTMAMVRERLGRRARSRHSCTNMSTTPDSTLRRHGFGDVNQTPRVAAGLLRALHLDVEQRAAGVRVDLDELRPVAAMWKSKPKNTLRARGGRSRNPGARRAPARDRREVGSPTRRLRSTLHLRRMWRRRRTRACPRKGADAFRPASAIPASPSPESSRRWRAGTSVPTHSHSRLSRSARPMPSVMRRTWGSRGSVTADRRRPRPRAAPR